MSIYNTPSTVWLHIPFNLAFPFQACPFPSTFPRSVEIFAPSLQETGKQQGYFQEKKGGGGMGVKVIRATGSDFFKDIFPQLQGDFRSKCWSKVGG